jgi:hypothetical protein
MRRHRNAVNALLFFAPIGVVLSAIPQAPDVAPLFGWGLTVAMLLSALFLALHGRRADASADESVDVLDREPVTGHQR